LKSSWTEVPLPIKVAEILRPRGIRNLAPVFV
jgi:hypothetical protein